MKFFLKKKYVFLIILILLFPTACNGSADQSADQNADQNAEDSQAPSAASPLNIAYCNTSSADLCLEGFGEEGEAKLLILFKADNPLFNDIYIGIEKDKDEVLFQCLQSQEFPENIYCSGDLFPNGESIQLNVYSKDKELIAEGEFTIQYGDIQQSDDVELEDSESETSSADYPSSSYPNYPNSSYENPTSTP